MSRAFVKEDIDVPERSNRRRTASGLPPGALNYMTECGAEVLRERLDDLKGRGADPEEIARLEGALQSATIVPPSGGGKVAVFGATVSLQNPRGERRRLRIAGVDEMGLKPENVSWVSPLGKALLGAALNQRLKLPGEDATYWTVAAIE